MQENSACVHYSGASSLRRVFTTLMHYAENECVIAIGLHCNEIRALCLTTNAICRTAEIGALLLKCVLIVYIWPEKGVEQNITIVRAINSLFKKFQQIVKKYIIFREGVLPRYRGKTPFCKVLGKTFFFRTHPMMSGCCLSYAL